jgi:hypothetical protein
MKKIAYTLAGFVVGFFIGVGFSYVGWAGHEAGGYCGIACAILGFRIGREGK